MSEPRPIALTVNGEVRRAVVEVRATLVDVLREQFRLTGTHVGCEHGVCGACTVLVDGEAVRGCLLLAVQADGSAIHLWSVATGKPVFTWPGHRERRACARCAGQRRQTGGVRAVLCAAPLHRRHRGRSCACRRRSPDRGRGTRS